jgi:hypothetical protein
MKSQGTKETQGINGDAAALQRRLAAVAASSGGGAIKPCPYPYHRATDWRLAQGGPIVCGVCHPPASGLDVTRRPARAAA